MKVIQSCSVQCAHCTGVLPAAEGRLLGVRTSEPINHQLALYRYNQNASALAMGTYYSDPSIGLASSPLLRIDGHLDLRFPK